MTNGGIASLCLFKIDRIHYSMFDVGRSTFVGFFSMIRLDARSQRLPLL
ncbi:hypothetical protein D1AOALGA4SA_6720 [Olavius algarvensis Delta 1 endosymbiont]|nr:hypothetical protein D1AOALGA4SA_6720 [Olavius algarvensis Delta 1 endosymbiont]